MSTDDPRCPACGEPIGVTATYCMHCRTNLTEKHTQAATNSDEEWGTVQSSASSQSVSRASNKKDTDGESLLGVDWIPTSFVRVMVSLIGGFVIGLIEFVIVPAILPPGWDFAAVVLVWVGATLYLVQRRTLQETVLKAGYGIAIAILSFPLIVFGSTWDASSRISDFVLLAIYCAIPAFVVGSVGLIVSRLISMSVSKTNEHKRRSRVTIILVDITSWDNWENKATIELILTLVTPLAAFVGMIIAPILTNNFIIEGVFIGMVTFGILLITILVLYFWQRSVGAIRS